MWTPVYFVRLVPLPASVHGVTLPNDDGTFDIYINETLSEAMRKDRLQHEIKHICEDHFYQEAKAITQLEQEANGAPVTRRHQIQFPLPLPGSQTSLRKRLPAPFPIFLL